MYHDIPLDKILATLNELGIERKPPSEAPGGQGP
jgi:hypothetical protein